MSPTVPTYRERVRGCLLGGAVADDFVREMSEPEQITDGWGGATTAWFARYPGG